MPETRRCGHPKTPENTMFEGSHPHGRCLQCRKARQRKENMTPEKWEVRLARQRKENMTLGQVKARNDLNRASYAAGGSQYRGAVRASARKTIKTLGLNLDDYPRFKLLKDQEGS